MYMNRMRITYILNYVKDGGTLESDPLNGPSTISDVTIAEIELSPHTGEEDPHLVRDQNKTFERIVSFVSIIYH